MAADNTYSRVVNWLKIVLPLIALAMLSSIFLVSRTIDPNDAIPYAEVDVEDRIKDPRLTESTFSGMTADGAAVTVDAIDMRPDQTSASKGTATGLRALMETPDGAVTEIVAANGRIDTLEQTMHLAGGVIVTSSSGYRITAPDMTGSLLRTDLNATGGVVANGPLGSITSETMRITQDAAGSGAYLLVFNNRVRLIYQPQTGTRP